MEHQRLTYPLGWVIQCVKNDGSIWYIDIESHGPYEVVKNPVLYSHDRVTHMRRRLISQFGFDGSPPYPYGIVKWQTAELFVNSKMSLEP